MKRVLMVLCWFVTGFFLKAQAGSILGADIYYYHVGPNTYEVFLKQARDCAAAWPSSTYSLELSSQGCTVPGRTVVLTKQGPAIAMPNFCPAPANVCAPASQPGIAVYYIYSAIVTFSPAEVACSEWTMGVTLHDDTRTATANLVGPSSLYLEAFVKLDSTINNNSAEFLGNYIPYKTAQVNFSNHYQLNGVDPDGDSLVYTLKSPLQASGIPVTYQPGFSARNPLVSNPASVFDSVSGRFIFKPTVFISNAAPGQGGNRYVAAFQVDEYRNVNGGPKRIGSVQRDMILEVEQPDTTQRAPFIKNFTVNGLPFDTAQVVLLPEGQSTVVSFETDDLNAGDSLTYFHYANSLPFANITVADNGVKPRIEMVLTPALNYVRPDPYFYLFRLQDDACPFQNSILGLLKFEVVQISGARPGFNQKALFTAYPNPFTTEINFRLSGLARAESILIYTLASQLVDEITIPRNVSGEAQVQWQNAPKYAAGTYLAKLINADKTTQTLKFTKLQ